MTYGIPLEEMLARLPEDERKAVFERAEELKAEYASLKELRRMAGLTQARLSESLGMAQNNVSRLEKNSDMLLSTLRSYVEAVGGKLNLTVELPDAAPIHLTGLGDLVDTTADERPGSR